jgi:hypothetical protein
LQTRWRFEETGDHVVGEIAAECFLDKPVADFHSLGFAFRRGFRALSFAQEIEHDGEKQHDGGGYGEYEIAELGQGRLRTRIMGHEDLYGDEQCPREDAKCRGEKNPLKVEEHHGQCNYQQVVQLHSSAGSKQKHDKEEVRIGEDQSGDCSRQRGEAVQEGKRLRRSVQLLH